MNLQVATPTAWMLCGVVPAKPQTASLKLPDRMATQFGLSLQRDRCGSEGEPAAIIMIADLGQAAPSTFVLLRVDGIAGPIQPMLIVINIGLFPAFRPTINYNVEGRAQPAIAWRTADQILSRHHSFLGEPTGALLPRRGIGAGEGS